jgi:hypothetical protein
MKLEDYFDFLSPDDIRLKGHRIGIDNVLAYYLQWGFKKVCSVAFRHRALALKTLFQIFADFLISSALRLKATLRTISKKFSTRFAGNKKESKKTKDQRTDCPERTVRTES